MHTWAYMRQEQHTSNWKHLQNEKQADSSSNRDGVKDPTSAKRPLYYIWNYILQCSNGWLNIYKSYTHSYISIYLNILVEGDSRVGKGSSVLKALGELPGSGKGCQGSKLCSILQVSETYVRLCSLAAVDRVETGGSGCRPWRSFQDRQVLPGFQGL